MTFLGFAGESVEILVYNLVKIEPEGAAAVDVVDLSFDREDGIVYAVVVEIVGHGLNSILKFMKFIFK